MLIIFPAFTSEHLVVHYGVLRRRMAAESLWALGATTGACPLAVGAMNILSVVMR